MTFDDGYQDNPAHVLPAYEKIRGADARLYGLWVRGG